MGDFIKKDMDKLVSDMWPERVMVNMPDVTEAMEAVQDDMVNELISRLIEIVESEATIEHDENEDGSFTTVVVDTPNTRELLKDAILDNYRLETK